jgi:hypothetical protein
LGVVVDRCWRLGCIPSVFIFAVDFLFGNALITAEALTASVLMEVLQEIGPLKIFHCSWYRAVMSPLNGVGDLLSADESRSLRRPSSWCGSAHAARQLLRS